MIFKQKSGDEISTTDERPEKPSTSVPLKTYEDFVLNEDDLKKVEEIEKEYSSSTKDEKNVTEKRKLKDEKPAVKNKKKKSQKEASQVKIKLDYGSSKQLLRKKEKNILYRRRKKRPSPIC